MDIYGQLYHMDGTPNGNSFIINDNQNPSERYGPSIGMDDAGNFIVSWRDDRNEGWDPDIYAQRFLSDGTAIGDNFVVNDGQDDVDQYYGTVAVDSGGNFVITWADRRSSDCDIYAQRYSNNGTPIGDNFKVNDDVGDRWQLDPNISMDDDGNFIIAWEDWRNDKLDVYAQLFLSDGSKLENNFKVNDDDGSSYQDESSIALNDSGHCVITWTDERSDYGDIYAQYFTDFGTKFGPNFRVNDDPGIAEQSNSAVAIDDEGNFIITWTDTRSGDEDVYGQRYLQDGSPFGNNFCITDVVEKEQWDSEVKLWNGRIYSAWTDNRTGGTGYDMWANVLDWVNPTDVEEEEEKQIPKEFRLSQNYPNPFNAETTISFALPKPGFVTLRVYDLKGREVETLVNQDQSPGYYTVKFRGEDLPSGLYLYRIETEGFVQTKKLILQK